MDVVGILGDVEITNVRRILHPSLSTMEPAKARVPVAMVHELDGREAVVRPEFVHLDHQRPFQELARMSAQAVGFVLVHKCHGYVPVQIW